MGAAPLLNRLQGVRRAGDGWRADCPNGHARARGSLAVCEADDGRVLLHCFACQDTTGILRGLGVTLAELYPERLHDPSPEARGAARKAFKRHAWTAALGVLGREAKIAALAAHDLMNGRVLDASDCGRLALAAQRIEAAREVLV
jgi:hypothetical protein